MKLYYHPISTTCRPVQLFLAEEKVSYEPVLVDLMTGAQYQEPFVTLNPSAQVPMLDDDGFLLAESAAILQYLADKLGSALYPKELRARARVNERLCWFNTGFYRDLGYNLVYPQVLPTHKRDSDEVTAGTVRWGVGKTERWLRLLDQNMLGDSGWVAGPSMTIADLFGGGIATCGDLVRIDWDKFPRVAAWLGRIRGLSSWPEVAAAHEGFVQQLAGQSLIAV